MIRVTVFLTDDGSTDGTSQAIKSTFPNRDIKIIQGNGNLFWAGGMRAAWQCALLKSKWNFYLLMNDDTLFDVNAFEELIATHQYSIQAYRSPGVYSGIISSLDRSTITYGGKVYSSGLFGKSVSIRPTGYPQICKMTNANILLVSNLVVKNIGILDEHYMHSCADWAYGIEASRNGFPVLVTGKICGYCDNDHDTEEQEHQKLRKMSIKDRKRYFNSPLHSTNDILFFMRKYTRWKYPFVVIARVINIFFPSLYYFLSSKRSK